MVLDMNTVFLSRDEVRAIDRRAIAEYGMPGIALMENAGAAQRACCCHWPLVDPS